MPLAEIRIPASFTNMLCVELALVVAVVVVKSL